MANAFQKTIQRSSLEKTRTQQSTERSTGSHDAQRTSCGQGYVPFQADAIHSVCFTRAIVSIQHLHSIKSCSQKTDPSRRENGHSAMIAIEYSNKLGRKKFIYEWCKLG